MFTPVTLEELDNARQDVESLEVVVNGLDTEVVNTRLGQTYPTLSKFIKDSQVLVQSTIDTVVEDNMITTNLISAGDGETQADKNSEFELLKFDTGITATAKGVQQVSRLQSQKNSDFVHAKDYGLVGDGSDETDKLNAMFAYSVSKNYVFESSKKYGYNSSGLTIPSDSKIITNGSTFLAIGQHLTNSLKVLGNNIYIDQLKIESVFNDSADRYDQKGISIVGNNIVIGEVSTISDSSRTGAFGNTTNSIAIGDIDTASSNINIGRIVSKNWDRPVAIVNCSDWDIGSVDVENYLRAVYIKDSVRGRINGGSIRGLSPSSKGRAGENGLLIEATVSDGSVQDIHINNLTVEDAGEHSFRIGGQKVTRDVWFNSCSSYRSGSGIGTGIGSDGQGGCGFKVLGATAVYGSRHQNINYTDCHVYDINNHRQETGLNFAGFYMGKVVGGSIANCSVGLTELSSSYVTPSSTSCDNGIELIGVEDVRISNPSIYHARNDGVLILDYVQSGFDWGICTNIVISGGNISNPLKNCVHLRATNATIRRVSTSGLLCNGGESALKLEKEGSGSFLNITFEATCWLQSVETLIGAESVLAKLSGTTIGNSFCRGGSVTSDWASQKLKTQAANNLGWSDVVSSIVVTVPVESFIKIPVIRKGQQIFVTSETSQYYCHAYIRPSGSPTSLVISKGTNFDVFNTVLTGVTGTSNFISLGVQDSFIFLENRTTVPREIKITIL